MKVEDIWLDYSAALKRFVHAKISNVDDVEDVLQEILLKTHQNLASIKDKNSVKSWLFQVANNAIIDFYRKNGRRLESSEIDVVEDENSANTVRLAISACVQPFIKALPQEDATLLTAIDINEQSQKDYAREIGVSYSTLKSRVQKSRERLKKVFDDCCHYQRDKDGTVYGYENKPIKRTDCQ